MRYPPAQPVTIMLIATATLALPKTFPTTVGIVEKKPPFDMPLMRTKTISGPMVVDAGHMASMLMAVNRTDTNSVLSDPIRSHAKPDTIRPTAEARLKPATRPAPAVDEKPRELV